MAAYVAVPAAVTVGTFLANRAWALGPS